MTAHRLYRRNVSGSSISPADCQQAVQDPRLAQNDLPRVCAYEVAHPQRDDHRHVHELLVALDLEGEQIGQRVGEQKGQECHPEGDAGGEQDGIRVELGAEQPLVVLQGQLVGDRPISEPPEGVDQQQDVRNEEQGGDESNR